MHDVGFTQLLIRHTDRNFLRTRYVSAACALLRATISPPEAALQKQRAIDRVLLQVYRVLTLQIDLLEAKKIIIPIQLSKASKAHFPITHPPPLLPQAQVMRPANGIFKQLLVCDLQTTYDNDGVPMGNFEVSFSYWECDDDLFTPSISITTFNLPSSSLSWNLK
jgi:hypothetical protein